MAINFEKIEFKDFQEPAVGAENLNQLQENVQQAFNEISDISESISDTIEVEDKTKIAPSIRLTEELIQSQQSEIAMETQTWQPVLSVLNETAPTITYEFQNGVYTKIGNLAFIDFHIRGKVTALNGTNNYVLIPNLPLPNRNGDYGNTASTVNLSLIMGLLSNDVPNPSGYIDSNGIRIMSITSGAFGKLKVTEGTRFDFRGAGWYHIDA